jgi:hypothetical protein
MLILRMKGISFGLAERTWMLALAACRAVLLRDPMRCRL